MKRVLIDTDPGIDDTAALLLALASPELSIEALTTVYGNGTVEACTRNALIILETAGRGDIPVHQGVGKPLLSVPHYAPHIHGSDALGDVGVPLPEDAPVWKDGQARMRPLLSLHSFSETVCLGPV